MGKISAVRKQTREKNSLLVKFKAYDLSNRLT
jgi:hypothetical protein